MVLKLIEYLRLKKFRKELKKYYTDVRQNIVNDRKSFLEILKNSWDNQDLPEIYRLFRGTDGSISERKVDMFYDSHLEKLSL